MNVEAGLKYCIKGRKEGRKEGREIRIVVVNLSSHEG